MLKITILGDEFYDEETETFINVGNVDLKLEHSLVSLSKWESKFEKPFLGKDVKTSEEVLWYVKAMIVTEDFPPDILKHFTQTNLDAINEYIDSKQSATTFGQMPKHTGKTETITSELIYYWMVSFNIPFECELWHLNRLFSLIRICNVKNSKPRKMGRQEMIQQRRELNAQRRQQLNSKG